MHLQNYQDRAGKTAIYGEAIHNYVMSLQIPDTDKALNLEELLRITYTILGLNGEAGELADKMKKLIRDSKGIITPAIRTEFIKENGDVLWYNSELSVELDSSLEAVAEVNLAKLESRYDRGVIQGSGDSR
jgi:NTP pyrophosphatase (non-canonical NTP hydrolase)